MYRNINDFDENAILKIIITYLYEGKSEREIQREILELPSPGCIGGFVVKDILQYFDIDESKKGILKDKDISEVFNDASGNFKVALEKILEYKRTEQQDKDNLQQHKDVYKIGHNK